MHVATLTPGRVPRPIVGEMTPPARAWTRWDLLPALPLLLFVIAGTRGAAEDQMHGVQPDLLAYLLVSVAALSLLRRRRAPLAGLVLCGVALSTYLALGYTFGPVLLTGPFAVYAVVEQVDLRRAVLASSAFGVATTVAVVPRFVDTAGWLELGTWIVAWTAVLAAPAAIGTAIRSRRQSAAEIRAEQARRAVADERLRMAQEVHDVVGHGLAAIAMQAGVALHVLDRSPERARESLQAIRVTSRDALDGLRAELEELRAPSGEPAARRPGPSLDDLPALIERMRAAGLDVTFRGVDGDRAIPEQVAHAAYRVVQESLTNVVRHAGAVRTSVTLSLQDGVLLVEVLDDGRPEPGATPGAPLSGVAAGGTGIDGMRWRAAALGGSLSAGARPGGGFAVVARLPIPSADGATAPDAAAAVATDPP